MADEKDDVKRANQSDLYVTMSRLLRRMEAEGEIQLSPFTDDEIALIKRGARIVQWLETLGWLGKQIMAIAAAVVLLISQWERISAALGLGK